MSRDLVLIVNSVANEKNIPKDVVWRCLEKSLTLMVKRNVEPESLVEVSLNDEGNMSCFRLWEVVDDSVRMDEPARQLRLMDAQDIEPQIKVGDFVKETIANPELTRVAARSLYQNLVQQLRQSQNSLTAEEWGARVHELVYGTVKRFSKGQVYLDIEGDEAILPKSEQLFERLSLGQRLPVVVHEINTSAKGPVLVVSRSSNVLLNELFKRECPEIEEGQVLIRHSVRSKHYRTRVLLESLNPSQKAVSVCIGYRGHRIQSISDALNQERLELIEWQGSMEKQIQTIFAGIPVERVVLEEMSQRVFVELNDKDALQKLRAIHGPDFYMLNQLYDYRFEVMDTSAFDALLQKEKEETLALFMEFLDADEELAEVLFDSNFKNLEDIAYCSFEELLNIEGFDHELVSALKTAAFSSILKKNALEEEWEGLESIPELIWEAFHSRGIHTLQDIADCSIYELDEIPGLSSEKAARLIMSARESLSSTH